MSASRKEPAKEAAATMSRGYDLLVEEADRIVSSTYPSQLKQLHTIVCAKCSDADLLSWAASRPCQIDSLARCLLEALQNWHYVLEIIARLCTSQPIRDALLKYDPNLLFETVSQAVSGSWKHNAASIAMLSHPLPSNITLPAACQTLFLGIVDHAAQSPSSASMRPVYQLLKGGLGPLLGLLSHEVLSQLEYHFLETLRTTLGQQDHCLSLYCFSVMKTIVAAAEEDVPFSSAGRYETQELLASTPDSPRWKPEGMKMFFNDGRKANKALHLVVMRVLNSTQLADKDTVDEFVECLGLANELVQYLPDSAREPWCAQNPLILRKLREKALQPGLDTRMSLQALAFLFSLCPSVDIPTSVVNHLSQVLSEPRHFFEKLTTGAEPPMVRFAELLSCGRLCDLFTALSSFALTAEPSELLNDANAIVATINCLTTSCDPSDSVSAGAVAALGSSSLTDALSQMRQIFSGKTVLSTMPGSGACSAALLQTRKKIAHALCSIFLKAALTADHTQTDVASDVYPTLIEVHALSSTPGGSCDHVKQQQVRIRTVGTHHALPYTSGSDWRDVLNEHLQSRVENEHNNLSKLFAHACGDLEKRCSDVETPLREERLRRAKLQEQYDRLNHEHAALESEKSRVAACIEDMEADKHETTRDLAEAREENDCLVARIEGVEADLRRNQEAAKEQLADLKRSMDVAEMEHATDLASNQEQLEDAQSRLSETQANLASKEAVARALQEQLDVASAASKTFESDRQTWTNAVDEYKRTIAAAEKAKDDLSTNCTKLLSDLKWIQDSLTAEKQSHQDDFAEARQRREQELQAAKEKSHRSIAEVQAQHLQEKESWEQQMEAAQQEARGAHDDLSSQLAKRDKKLADYSKKVEHLKGVVIERDEQIAEANAMRLNLMAAMGLGKQRSQATNRRSTRSAANREAAVDESDISIPFMDMLGSTTRPSAQRGLDFATQGNQAAPSPKRAKPRKSVRTMSPSQTLLTTFSQAAKDDDKQDRASPKRQPLLALSANRSPGKGGSKTPRKDTTKGRYAGSADDDTTFDGSEVFSCTPAVGRMAGNDGMLPDDETMLE